MYFAFLMSLLLLQMLLLQHSYFDLKGHSVMTYGKIHVQIGI